VLFICCISHNAFATQLWGTTNDQLFKVDTSTGQTTVVRTYDTSDLGLESGGFRGIAQASNGYLYATSFGGTTAVGGPDEKELNYLYRIDPSTGAIKNSWDLGFGPDSYVDPYSHFARLEFVNNNTLISSQNFDSNVLHVIHLNGDGSVDSFGGYDVVPLFSHGEAGIGGIAKNPVDGKVYATMDSGGTYWDDDALYEKTFLVNFDFGPAPPDYETGPVLDDHQEPIAFDELGVLWEATNDWGPEAKALLSTINLDTGDYTQLWDLSDYINGYVTGLSANRGGAPVPEPATMVLLLSGLASFSFFRIKRR
jgi:hypothetical protein